MILGMHNEEGKSRGPGFVSSNMAGLHHLYDNSNLNCIDKLQTLSNLKATGAITEYEFKKFKNHYLKLITVEN